MLREMKLGRAMPTITQLYDTLYLLSFRIILNGKANLFLISIVHITIGKIKHVSTHLDLSKYIIAQHTTTSKNLSFTA